MDISGDTQLELRGPTRVDCEPLVQQNAYGLRVVRMTKSVENNCMRDTRGLGQKYFQLSAVQQELETYRTYERFPF